jgi:hypothetical protein
MGLVPDNSHIPLLQFIHCVWKEVSPELFHSNNVNNGDQLLPVIAHIECRCYPNRCRGMSVCLVPLLAKGKGQR